MFAPTCFNSKLFSPFVQFGTECPPRYVYPSTKCLFLSSFFRVQTIVTEIHANCFHHDHTIELVHSCSCNEVSNASPLFDWSPGKPYLEHQSTRVSTSSWAVDTGTVLFSSRVWNMLMNKRSTGDLYMLCWQ